MSVRTWRVTQVLETARSLQEHINELSEEEVIAALELESTSSRRRLFIDRLISRAVRINELQYAKKLKEKYHGPYPIESPVQS